MGCRLLGTPVGAPSGGRRLGVKARRRRPRSGLALMLSGRHVACAAWLPAYGVSRVLLTGLGAWSDARVGFAWTSYRIRLGRIQRCEASAMLKRRQPRRVISAIMALTLAWRWADTHGWPCSRFAASESCCPLCTTADYLKFADHAAVGASALCVVIALAKSVPTKNAGPGHHTRPRNVKVPSPKDHPRC